MPADRPVPATFVIDHTTPDRPSLVPEVTLRVASDVVALWEAIEQDRGTAPTDPPFWAAAWPGGQALARVPADRPVPATFVLDHTTPDRPSLVPEVTLRVASDVVALWEAIEQERGISPTDPPFWAAAWPGGQALARHVLDRPDLVAGRSVLDLGSGSGLVAVAAALAGAARVAASDVDPFSHAAIAVNAEGNGIPPVEVLGDVLGEEPPDVDVVLAGDVCYDRVMSERVLPWLEAARARGAEVFLGDPGRPYVPVDRLERVATFDVPDTEGPQVRRTTVWRLP